MKILRARLYEAERERARGGGREGALVADRRAASGRRRSAPTTSPSTGSPTTASSSPSHNLDAVLAGDLDQFTQALAAEEKRRKLEAAAAGEARSASSCGSRPRTSSARAARRPARRRVAPGHALDLGRVELYSTTSARSASRGGGLRELCAGGRSASRWPTCSAGWGFHGLDLDVDRRVLVPRPETEVVVDRCLPLLDGVPSPPVVDVGTGTGAIALALATGCPARRCAGATSRTVRWRLPAGNGARLGIDVEWARSDLLDGARAAAAST